MFTAYVIALSLILHQQSKPSTPDLSTPESAVKELITLFSSGKYTEAAACVSGATDSPTLRKMERDEQRLKTPRFAMVVESATSEISGTTASVKVKVGINIPTTNSMEETLKVTLADGKWKVIPLTLVEVEEAMAAFRASKPAKVGIIIFGTSMLRHPDTFEKSREAARTVTCRTNLRQIGLAALMYVADNDDRFKINSTTYKSKIAKYLKTSEVYHCPSDSGVGDSYSFNRALEGWSLYLVLDPNTVLFYEGKNNVLDFRHDGKASVGFVDGRVTLVTAAEAKKLRWKP